MRFVLVVFCMCAVGSAAVLTLGTTDTIGGTFHDCIKVREAQAGLPAWRYDYYAPGIGRVRTTVAGPRFEKPNTELKSAKIPPPSFPVAGAAGTDTKP